MQNRNRHADTENKLMVSKGEMRQGREKLGCAINTHTHGHIETNSEDLLYSTGNYIQYLTIKHNGKEPGVVYLKPTQYYKSTIVKIK